MIQFLQRHRTLGWWLSRTAPKWVSRRVWNEALSDPVFSASLEQGLADLAAGRVVPWSAYRPTYPASLTSARDYAPEVARFEDLRAGTAATDHRAPDFIREASMPLLDRLYELARGEGGSLSFTLLGVPFVCSSSTGARAPSGSSTSTPTRSNDSPLYRGDC